MKKIHDSDWKTANYFIHQRDDTLKVELSYPPYTDADNKDGRCRHVEINQMAVRASDGIRVHYDYDRDGFVVEQPKPIIDEIDDSGCIHCGEEWIETGFFQSWHHGFWEDGYPPESEIAAFKAKQTAA